MSLDFSRAIYDLRKGRKLSQRAAAQELGISQALLSHYENGVRQPRLAFVRKIALYYGVSADELLGNAGDRIKTDAEQRLHAEFAMLLELINEDEEIVELSCAYLSTAVKNVRKILEIPDCPFDPRRYYEMTTAEAALFDALRGRGAKND